MDWSSPGSSIHEIFQAMILEWVAISFSIGARYRDIQFGVEGLKKKKKKLLRTTFFSSVSDCKWDINNLASALMICCCCLVAQSRQNLCDPMDCNVPGFPVLHHLLEFVQTHVHWVSDAIQPSYSLSSPSLPAFNHSQHRGLFQWVSSSNQVTTVLELQLQHQSFQSIFRTDFL